MEAKLGFGDQGGGRACSSKLGIPNDEEEDARDEPRPRSFKDQVAYRAAVGKYSA